MAHHATPAAGGWFKRLWRKLFGEPKLTLLQEIRGFLGDDFDRSETHDKNFPAYDLASLHRALASFFADCCAESRDVGAPPAHVTTMRQLFELLKQPYGRWTRPNPPTFQRIPVDVEEEESFVTGALYFAVMNPGAGRLRPRKSAALAPPSADGEVEAKPEKLAIFLAASAAAYEAWDGMDMRHVPRQVINLSVACRDKTVANRLFAEIEDRRKRLSVFRGKVIDPVVTPGGVATVGFRPIQRVRETDLILPDNVKSLIHGSILGFYKHRDLLEELGIEMKRGILFHGPPGTGKTSISLYLAGLLPHFTICFVSGERLLYPREVCSMGRYLQPAMIVFEDIDLVAMERNASGLATVLGELMNQIDGCEPTDQVLFIMNTNSLERLEHAVKNRPGRVDQIIEIPLPTRPERRQLIETFAKNVTLTIDDFEALLDATEGTPPAMLKEIVKRAAVNALQRVDGKPAGSGLEVSQADLMLATTQVRALRDPEAVPGAFGFRGEKL